jgi:hypothetical protein
MSTHYFINKEKTQAIAVSNKTIKFRYELSNGNIKETKLKADTKTFDYLKDSKQIDISCTYSAFLTLNSVNL